MAWSLLTVNVFIRQARRASESDLVGVLTTIQSGQFELVKKGNGQILSTSANGKAVSISVDAGLSRQDVMEICEVAIVTLEAGKTYASNVSVGRFC